MPPPTLQPVTTDCSTAYASATGRTSVPVSLSLCSRHRPTTTTSGRWKSTSPSPIRRKHSPRPTGCPTDMFWATCNPHGRSSRPAASILGIIWPPISSERRSACSKPRLRKTSATMPNWRHRANCSTRTLLWGSGHWSGIRCCSLNRLFLRPITKLPYRTISPNRTARPASMQR